MQDRQNSFDSDDLHFPAPPRRRPSYWPISTSRQKPDFTNPLSIAMEDKQEGIAISLISAGADPNAMCYYYGTVLHHAIKLQLVEVVDALLKHGANPNLIDNDGMTPLVKALDGMMNNDVRAKMVKLLIARGADVNKSPAKSDHTPLIKAIINGNIQAAEALVSAGADVSVEKPFGTPLIVAFRSSNDAMFKLIQKAVSAKRDYIERMLGRSGSETCEPEKSFTLKK